MFGLFLTLFLVGCPASLILDGVIFGIHCAEVVSTFAPADEPALFEAYCAVLAIRAFIFWGWFHDLFSFS